MDTVGATLMGFEAKHEVPMLRAAEMKGLGVATLEEIEVFGASIEKLKRPFRRGNIHLIGLHPKIDVYMGGACDGCLHFTRTGLDVYLANPKLMEGVEKITFIIGKEAEVPEQLDHDPPRSLCFRRRGMLGEAQGAGNLPPGLRFNQHASHLFSRKELGAGPGELSESATLEGKYRGTHLPRVDLTVAEISQAGHFRNRAAMRQLSTGSQPMAVSSDSTNP